MNFFLFSIRSSISLGGSEIKEGLLFEYLFLVHNLFSVMLHLDLLWVGEVELLIYFFPLATYVLQGENGTIEDIECIRNLLTWCFAACASCRCYIWSACGCGTKRSNCPHQKQIQGSAYPGRSQSCPASLAGFPQCRFHETRTFDSCAPLPGRKKFPLFATSPRRGTLRNLETKGR